MATTLEFVLMVNVQLGQQLEMLELLHKDANKAAQKSQNEAIKWSGVLLDLHEAHEHVAAAMTALKRCSTR
jgi:hypothetical protein